MNVPYRPTSAQDDIDQPIIDAGGVLEIPFITEDMAQKSLNKLTSHTIQKIVKTLPKTVQKLTVSIQTSKRLILNIEKLLKVFKNSNN